MKIRILKKAYKAPSGAWIEEHWIEHETDSVQVIIEQEVVKLSGVKGFPYNWAIPVNSNMEIKSQNKFGG